jgi:hypothetical protein
MNMWPGEKQELNTEFSQETSAKEVILQASVTLLPHHIVKEKVFIDPYLFYIWVALIWWEKKHFITILQIKATV